MSTIREDFEALARASEMAVKRNVSGGGYAHVLTQVAWDFYQAADKAATERAAKGEREECALECEAYAREGRKKMEVRGTALFCADRIRGRTAAAIRAQTGGEQT